MAHSFPPPQAPMNNYLSGSMHAQESSPLSAYSILGPTQYSESVALWNNPPTTHQQQQPPSQIPTAPYTSVPPKTPSLLQPIPDHKKHKRTRSGCFTCRARRIKCDETRPVCDRCRKGNRDCVYPSPTTASASSSKAGSRSAVKTKAPRPHSRGSDSSGHVETDDVRTLEPIADEEEEEETSPGSSSHLSPPAGSTLPARTKPGLPKKPSSQSLRRRRAKNLTGTSTEALVGRKENSSSPSTEEGSSRFESLSARSASVGFYPLECVRSPNTTNLPDDLRYYLSYHRDFLNYRHYFLGPLSAHFVNRTIVDLALQYDPLLYAIVGFSAYHHCVQAGTGTLYTFLKYYNKALTLLRQSLSGEAYHEATLITVLVLTTFEEFIGDWVNLIDHHQAAHVMIREVLTPESANTNEVHSNIFLWYARFDVVAGILAGNEMVLGREWYISKEEYDAEQAAKYPDDIEKQLALASSINRRFGLEMASLYAKLSRGMIGFEDFVVQNDQLDQTLERMKGILEQFRGSEYTVQTYPNWKPLTSDDIVDPYLQGGLYYGPLWEVNFAWIDYYSTKAMFKYQSGLALRRPSFEELGMLGIEQCRLIESIDRWPEKENGYMFGFKNSIGMASMFLPPDDKHRMWSRKKFALMEQNGYVMAPKFRGLIATIWQLPEINIWWLPNEEGYPAIIREVRAMTEERTNNPRDDFRESVRDMKSLFWNISLDDTESENSPSSAGGTDIHRPTSGY